MKTKLLERIELVEIPPGNIIIEALYDFSFGLYDNFVRPIPTLSELGLIAIAGVLGIIGMIAIHRRAMA